MKDVEGAHQCFKWFVEGGEGSFINMKRGIFSSLLQTLSLSCLRPILLRVKKKGKHPGKWQVSSEKTLQNKKNCGNPRVCTF